MRRGRSGCAVPEGDPRTRRGARVRASARDRAPGRQPENVLITPGGALLMDFGFATRRASTRADARETARHIVAHRLREPGAGARTRLGDWRSDYFSLGCVLSRCSPQSPYSAELARHDAAAHRRAGAHVRTANPDVPDDIAAIIRRTLERSPNDRYPTSLHLRMAIDGALARLDRASDPPSRRRAGARLAGLPGDAACDAARRATRVRLACPVCCLSWSPPRLGPLTHREGASPLSLDCGTAPVAPR
jgi:hypothetical protein